MTDIVELSQHLMIYFVHMLLYTLIGTCINIAMANANFSNKLSNKLLLHTYFRVKLVKLNVV